MSEIQKVDISKIMKNKYIDYAISVIIGRALPDVRDGMKWVHRRILYSMYELGLTPEKGYRKCARIVGDVLGKYHPHGDTAVYDALVRMAQDFSIRYKLVDGHGNFGSVDGDSAAAYRYTEAKLQNISLELLKDINKGTVDLISNFDGEEKEPVVLPSRFPNLLVNGSEGVAVGIATSIPPHNLNETIDAIIHQLNNPNCTINDLVSIIKAPDFPTGAEIINPKDMIKIYSNGCGKIIMRSKYHIENNEKYKNIIITEIPYQVNKSKLLENIFLLSKDSVKITTVNGKPKETIVKAKISDIRKITDESDRSGIRINIELKNNANVDKILSLLFKHSDLQFNYNANFNAIYGANELLENLNLKQILEYYINHQKEVLTRRTQFDLNKANKRMHILEGLKKAILNLDEAIELIKTSNNKNKARERLMDFLNIDEDQSNAILSLQLQRLTGLEIETIQNEYDELLKTIEKLNLILNNEQELLNVLKEELLEIKTKYGDKRRTQIIYEDTIQDISKLDLIEDYSTYCILTKEGYLKKLLRRTEDVKLKENDEILYSTPSSNKSTLLLFSNKGTCYKLYQHTLQECKPSEWGEYLPNILSLDKDEYIISMVSTRKYDGYLINVFENGLIAKIDLKSYETNTMRSSLKNALNTDSKLLQMTAIEKDIDVLLVTQEGKALIVNTSQINSKGSKNTKGTTAINLGNNADNKVVGCILDVNSENSFIAKTEKNKDFRLLLGDIAQTNIPNEERTWIDYLNSNIRNKGNYIYNCKVKNDKIIGLQIES